MSTELLPPSGYPIAVKYIISYLSPERDSKLSFQCLTDPDFFRQLQIRE